MTMGPKFSIITICLNESAGIRRTCESVVGQNHQDQEWIVIDGGSTDGTLEILDEHQSHISTLVSEPDGGIYEAMNKGIALSQGRYIVFMNGGDAFSSPEALQWVSEAPQVELLYGDIEFNPADKTTYQYPQRLDGGYLLDHMVPHQSSFFHRDLFQRFGDYDTSYRIAGDYEFFARILESGKATHHHLPRTLAIFNLGGISSSKAHRQLRKMENHRVRMKYFPSYRRSLKALRQGLRNFFCRG